MAKIRNPSIRCYIFITKYNDYEDVKNRQGQQALQSLKRRLRVSNHSEMHKQLTYLFNGKEPRNRMSPAGLRQAMTEATKKAVISSNINLHILHHCGVYPDGYRGLLCPGGGHEQYLMGHSSVLTNMVYLHVSEVHHQIQLFEITQQKDGRNQGSLGLLNTRRKHSGHDNTVG